MSKEFEEKMSVGTNVLNAVLDKALCEKEFRWKLVSNPNEIIDSYGITDEKDIAEIKKIVDKANGFVVDRLCSFEDGTQTKYKNTNPKLVYEEALERRH
ncbi:MAG: hypothetical protein E7278_03945 [Lachnospiraceae bacterium]|jgi:hypothetical protein|nr:hypothetical protein [Lachnospiraceae bacterium]